MAFLVIPEEIKRIKSILDSFLGEPKSEMDSSLQLEYGCPRCEEKYGSREHDKHNLSISLKLMKFNCWKCSSEMDDDMHGSVSKLIKMYGGNRLYEEYKQNIKSLRESKLYNFASNDLEIDIEKISEISLPKTFRPFKKDRHYPLKAMEYLNKRGIDWDIIEKYNMGFTTYENENHMLSNRVIIPSYNKFGELNYWTGRDFTGKSKQKYANPKIERKKIIFNEETLEYNADITLVEGPFDHIVVPNSVPLLGKVLNQDFDLYWKIINSANANVNIWLDGDAFESVKTIYRNLNHGRLYGKIRYVPIKAEYDPSLVFEMGGRRAILNCLKHTKKIDEVYLY